jgi:hypothetical protein
MAATPVPDSTELRIGGMNSPRKDCGLDSRSGQQF